MGDGIRRPPPAMTGRKPRWRVRRSRSGDGEIAGVLERFRAKWVPVRVKKTRQIKNLEPRSDSIGTEKALGRQQSFALLPSRWAWTEDEARKRARAKERRADHDRDELQTGVKNNRAENEPACRDRKEDAEP